MRSMRTKAIGAVIAAVLASVGSGQSPTEQSLDRVFYFTQAASPQSMQEIVNIIRAMTDIQQASRDNAQRTLALRGTADQIALAEWLFNKLDQPASGQAPAQ